MGFDRLIGFHTSRPAVIKPVKVPEVALKGRLGGSVGFLDDAMRTELQNALKRDWRETTRARLSPEKDSGLQMSADIEQTPVDVLPIILSGRRGGYVGFVDPAINQDLRPLRNETV